MAKTPEIDRLRGALTLAKTHLERVLAALELSEQRVLMLEGRLSTAADKQILLLNKLITRDDTPHTNSETTLPPVDCPLLIEVATGLLVPALRPAFVEHRGNDLTYRLSDGTEIIGQFRWTYP